MFILLSERRGSNLLVGGDRSGTSTAGRGRSRSRARNLDGGVLNRGENGGVALGDGGDRVGRASGSSRGAEDGGGGTGGADRAGLAAAVSSSAGRGRGEGGRVAVVRRRSAGRANGAHGGVGGDLGSDNGAVRGAVGDGGSTLSLGDDGGGEDRGGGQRQDRGRDDGAASRAVGDGGRARGDGLHDGGVVGGGGVAVVLASEGSAGHEGSGSSSETHLGYWSKKLVKNGKYFERMLFESWDERMDDRSQSESKDVD